MSYAPQSLEHPSPLGSHGLEGGQTEAVEGRLQFLHGDHVPQVPLVPLEDHGNVRQVQAQGPEVLPQVQHALAARVQHGRLAVHHEDDAIHPLQHQLAGLVVEDLARHGVELQACAVAPHQARFQGQQVEEQGPVSLRVQAHHLAPALAAGLAVDGMEVGGLAAQAGAVVDDLHRHIPGGVIEKNHSGTPLDLDNHAPEHPIGCRNIIPRISPSGPREPAGHGPWCECPELFSGPLPPGR